MNQKITLPSPAKLNLFLHINGRLPNGYHELQTLFHFVDFGDTLSFEVTAEDDIALTCSDKSLETDDNLITRAAKTLSPYRKKENGIKIHLDKVLPMGGGVGGGSSNAATTLLALNELWQLGLPLIELEKIGKTLGADVPIFVHGQTAVADGIGEQFTDINLDDRWYLVLMPNIHVNTANLFRSADLPRNTEKLPLNEFNYSGLAPLHKNDFQNLVEKTYPEIAKCLHWLLQYAPSRLTGTGACVFAEFNDEHQANQVFQQLPEEMSGFIAKGCNTSPTHRSLFG